MDDHQPGDSVPHIRETRITCTADGWEIDGRHYGHAMLDGVQEEVWLPVLNTDSSSALCARWLDQVSPLLSKYDAALLRRYIPDLPTQSLQKVWFASRSDYLNYLAGKVWQSEQHGAVEQISKMAMRRILDTTFARLALHDPDIHTVYEQWASFCSSQK